jgi:hypothetical protein
LTFKELLPCILVVCNGDLDFEERFGECGDSVTEDLAILLNSIVNGGDLARLVGMVVGDILALLGEEAHLVVDGSTELEQLKLERFLVARSVVVQAIDNFKELAMRYSGLDFFKEALETVFEELFLRFLSFDFCTGFIK